MQTDNLELKKLVYLYLMNYAKSQPDMAIMAVNSFVKVTSETPHQSLLLQVTFLGASRYSSCLHGRYTTSAPREGL